MAAPTHPAGSNRRVRRSCVRRGGLVLAALAVPALLVGTASATTPAARKLARATLDGDGSTFQLAFNQVTIAAFKQQQPSVTVNYQGNGSGAGRTDFANGVVDFAGTDAPYQANEPQPRQPFFYFPTVVAPITVAYHLPGVELQLSADTVAEIFSGAITRWDDAAIEADNPKAKLPSTSITVVHRSDSSGTTANFTRFLAQAAPSSWTLGSGSTVSWPARTQGATGNSGVAKLVQDTEGAIGYVDFSDANASELTYAAVENARGTFVKPTLASAAAAARSATVNADLTYDPIGADGAEVYPITSPTWIVVARNQTDAAKGNAVTSFLHFVYDEGQQLASSVDYAPLPKALVKQAKAQVGKIRVPSSSP